MAEINESIANFLSIQKGIKIFRSKGLLAHLINRKHYAATKYLDYLSDIIRFPDYAGTYKGQIEFVKRFKENIFVSVKLDKGKNTYYVATLFDVKEAKILAYCKSGRLRKVKTEG